MNNIQFVSLLKLPKDFMMQAETYQKELDAAVKEYQEMQG